MERGLLQNIFNIINLGHRQNEQHVVIEIAHRLDFGKKKKWASVSTNNKAMPKFILLFGPLSQRLKEQRPL